MDFRSRHRVKAEFNLASLTDMVFLLLIFFMLTSSFVAPTAVRLLLPRAKGQVITPQHFRIAIRADGALFWEGQPIELEQLPQALSEARKQFPPEEPPVVVIRADRRVQVERLVQVLDVGRQAGVKMILATTPES